MLMEKLKVSTVVSVVDSNTKVKGRLELPLGWVGLACFGGRSNIWLGLRTICFFFFLKFQKIKEINLD